MKIKFIKIAFVFLFVTVCTNAQDKKPLASTSSTVKLVSLYDGKTAMNIFLMEGYIAELGISSEKNSRIKSVDTSATPVRNLGFAQVFKVNDQSLLNGGKVSAKASKSGKFSAVYSRSGDDSNLVIPIGFIVTYKSSIADSEIAAIELKYSVSKGKKLPIENLKMYSYEAESGQTCLDLANSLRSESIVESTSVDFIEERVRK
jgi:hypothetical protein